MEKFDVRCPDHYPMKCNISKADKDYLITNEKYKAFFIFQYKKQDEWLEKTLEKYFNDRTWRLFNAGKEGGTGTKFCNICRYALASDFEVVSLTPLNYNVFQEIGLMQGFQKPLLYLLNPDLKGKLPFDIDDQIYIEHTNEKTLIEGLDNRIPLLLDKVQLLTGIESDRRDAMREKVKGMTPDAVELLKRMVIEGPFKIQRDDLNHFVKYNLKCDPQSANQLVSHRFIVDEWESGGSRVLKFRKFNENYRKDLEEILWE